MNTILGGIIDLLSDAVAVADPRMPAEFSGGGGPVPGARDISPARRLKAWLFLAALALAPLVVMALTMR